ncbi:MAG: hypothetical protein LBB56_03600 [Chitinispirillales bacterium]|nr:hypothetical protein [Chitinispirillales bacterium]
MLKRFFKITLLCAAAALLMSGCAVFNVFKAKITRVTDVSGYTSDVTHVRFTKNPQIIVDCGGARMEFLFNTLRSMKIDRQRITSIDGQLYFGVEVELKNGTVFGKSQEKGSCYICADNGLEGISSKSGYTVSFDKLSGFTVLGKGEE